LQKRTKSILAELDSHFASRDTHNFVESRANNIIQGAINLIQYIHENFDQPAAEDLERRILNSIRARDPRKFSKAVQRLKESKNQ
jgi:hypothetical protein